MSTSKHIFKIFKEDAVQYFWAIMLVVFGGIFSALLPKMLGQIIDEMENKIEIEIIYKHILFYLLIGTLIFAIKYGYRKIIIGNSRKIEMILRVEVLKSFLNISFHKYNSINSGEIISYIIGDIGAIRRSFAIGLLLALELIATNLFTIAVMFLTLNRVLVMYAIIPLVLSVFFILILNNKIRNSFRLLQESLGILIGRVCDYVGGLYTIKAFTKEKEIIEYFNFASKERKDRNISYIKISGLLNPVVMIFIGVSLTTTMVISTKYISQDVITLGDFIALNTYLFVLIGPISRLAKIVEIYQNLSVSSERLDKILMDTGEKDTGISMNIQGNIEFKDVNFTYENDVNLKDISFKLEAGQILGICGEVGSGKSTLISLILKNYLPNTGNIFLDGVNIEEISKKSITEAIGIVTQEAFLFTNSIYENINFDGEYDDEEIFESAKNAHIHKSINKFKSKYETYIGERGVKLSGGQKQRLSMARTFIRHPNVLILDDSMSALDSKTEKKIIENIEDFNLTKIIISHKLSSIRNADLILVMKDGSIIDRGTSEYLEKNCKEFRKIFKLEGALNEKPF